jgi:hypothetical protein
MTMERATALAWKAGAALVACLALVGCAKDGSEQASDAEAPAVVEAVTGTHVKRVTLTADAVRRIDVQLEPVTDAARGGRAIPYAAVFYDPDGATWVFTNPEGRTFVRKRITVARIDGDHAFLSDGPTRGTEVVTVGGPEIYGAELGVGDDE